MTIWRFVVCGVPVEIDPIDILVLALVAAAINNSAHMYNTLALAEAITAAALTIGRRRRH